MEQNRSVENGDVAPYELTNAERERLACLAEEAGEIVQIVGKILRHGYESYNPNDAHKVTNRLLLEKELVDFHVVWGLMETLKDVEITQDKYEEFSFVKMSSLNKYLHYNKI